ncbi:IS3 family transposase [Spiroplasma endosymbiont of Polydrusus pterygomalis]|uniref:IS3 family transposase n=1 Tax=Spiroplasma endosymbiont of Polydrusus pterygomalis TaxID=3139327 RepID=UPI003CCAE9F4
MDSSYNIHRIVFFLIFFKPNYTENFLFYFPQLWQRNLSYDTWNKYSKNCDEYQPNIDYSIYEIIKAIHRENSIKGHRQIKLSLEEQKINVSNSTVYRYMKLANRISSVRIKTRKKIIIS